MCGFVGIITKNKSSTECQRKIREMNALIHHRGPDDEGYYNDEKQGVYLGFKRLSIIDLSENGHQPMSSKNGNITLVFNGEVYNFKEIKEELKMLGHHFDSKTDSEVVLRSYEQWGEDCVYKFRGMFAIAIWDANLNKLVIFRDRLGIKPLYYYKDAKQFCFSSETKALFNIISEHSLSEKILSEYIHFPYIPDNENTIVNGIKKLPAGHKLVWRDSMTEITPYWDLEEEAGKYQYAKNNDELIGQLDSLLHESIRLRLVADVPLGIMLSGGLDSSYITAVASRMSDSRMHSFTVGLNHQLDERSYANEVANHVGTDHTEMMISNEGVFERLPSIVSVYDDLSTSDGGIISVYLMCQKIRENNIKVLLLGEGADELFGGYSWFGISKLPFRLMPKTVQMWFYYHGFAKASFQPGARSAINELLQMMNESRSHDDFQTMSRYEIKHQLPNNFLMKVDKASMANSIEARVPFMDHKVVEFAYGLNSNLKLRGNWFSHKSANEKYILRECARKYLPQNISTRKKQGFLLSIPNMIKGNITKVQETLQNSSSLVSDILGGKQLEKLFKEEKLNLFEKQRLNLLWKLYLLELWYHNVLIR